MASYEVEAKFQIPCHILEQIKTKLESLGAQYLTSQSETDIYFSHPCRNFIETDEALRVRIVDDKIQSLTYKGPRKKRDLKVREEIIVNISEENIILLLERLGFYPAITIKKFREYYRLNNTLITIDQVEGLGCFIEIEIHEDKDSDKIVKIARTLGIEGDPIVKSYVELLMLAKRS
jgi:adenylate cyclase class 2